MYQILHSNSERDLINIGYSITDTTEWIAYYGSGVLGNTTAVPPVFNANITVPAECQYLIYEPTRMSLDYYMASFLNGSVTVNPDRNYDYDTNGPVQINRFCNLGRMSIDSVSAIFSNISDSMTAYIRQSNSSDGHTLFNDDQAAPAPGHVWQTETCIEVRWGYLAFPIALVLLTMIFLVAVIMETSHHQEADAWKSSALALLFHGLDPRTRDLQGAGMESMKEMETAAKGMRVRLRRGERGLVFVNTN
ncbi:hypothetical protein LPUS_03036 [Lasallia pustulata]|uniref:Uncharacterized protein n=1 Tax=Lasallia pustulata TaxID=136370 RepID=A0A1W5CU29_9LECA|nr:hypothetical protein LPUS_03036 [Lasallia pustulata]